MSFFSGFLQDFAASYTPSANGAQLAPIKDEPPPSPRPGTPPPAASTPMTDAVEPCTPKRRPKASKNTKSSGKDDHEPSPAYDELSRAAKTRFRSIMRKRNGNSSDKQMWYCRENCDMPFGTKSERTNHERRCAKGQADRRFWARRDFEAKIAGRSNEDVLSEWEALMQESTSKFRGGAAEGGGDAEGEAQEKEQQRLKEENLELGGLQHAGGKDTAPRDERTPRGVFSTEFMLKYGATQIEENDARKATFAEFTANYGAADVEQAQAEVQVKVEDDGNGEIPLGENWWVPQ